MNWQEVCANPALRDLPFKIELNTYGQVVMSPASNWHGSLQTKIGLRLFQTLGIGEIITECSIQTSDNVKVADVAWLSPDFHAIHQMETPFTSAPEICVEILSPSNTTAEMAHKRALYFGAGAQEVWQCDEDGVLTFFTKQSPIETSTICPNFPKRI